MRRCEISSILYLAKSLIIQKILIFVFKRSGAPSQIHTTPSLKRKSCSAIDSDSESKEGFSYTANASAWKKLSENCAKKKNKKHDNYDSKQFQSNYRKPLECVTNNSSSKTVAVVSKSSDSSNSSQSSHDAFLKGLTNPRFKMPVPNYVSSFFGVKRQGNRQPVYDLDSENALILYSPPILSATDLLNADKFLYNINL